MGSRLRGNDDRVLQAMTTYGEDLRGRPMMFPPSSCPRLIVKIGSALLVDPDGSVRRDWLAGLVADIATRTRAGQQVAIVSSGAIALGARRLGLAKGGRASLEDAQAAAATGQIALSQVWAELLAAQGLNAAQMLVTLDDLFGKLVTWLSAFGMEWLAIPYRVLPGYHLDNWSSWLAEGTGFRLKLASGAVVEYSQTTSLLMLAAWIAGLGALVFVLFRRQDIN